MEVIKAVHGPNGNLDNASRAKRIGGCWGLLASLPLALSKANFQFREFFLVYYSPKWHIKMVMEFWKLGKLLGLLLQEVL